MALFLVQLRATTTPYVAKVQPVLPVVNPAPPERVGLRPQEYIALAPFANFQFFTGGNLIVQETWHAGAGSSEDPCSSDPKQDET